jgi:cytochrome c oxidase subunit II
VRRVAWLGGFAGAVVLALSGCSSKDDQNTLAPHSTAAHSIATLWWVMFIGSLIVVGVVIMLVLLALLKRRGRLDRVETRRESPRARTVVLVAGAVVPAVVLTALFVYVLANISKTSEPNPSASRMTIDVTGKQWFWAVRYPAQGIVTANEVHIPVGVPVRIEARTSDVIHSFWVPELNRKIDMIPGADNSVLLETDRAGVYRGQCAEFCGLQHANMAFYVVAQPRAAFDAWVAREQRPPQTSAPGAGVFTTVGCGGCHTIKGLSNGTVGPDLTHVGGRRSLAAGTIPNAKGWLGGWILDPQHIKPGNKMPALPVSGPQLQQLLGYLESLK